MQHAPASRRSVARPRARAAASLVVAAALTLGGLAASAPPTQAGESDDRITIGTYNLKAKVPVSGAVQDIRRLTATGVDVLGLQEMRSGPRKAAIQRSVTCGGCAFDAFLLDNTGAASSSPIIWRKSVFQLVAGGARQVSRPTFVGPRGAGGPRTQAKFVTWVELEHIATGLHIYVLNNHAVPTVDVKHPRAVRLRLHHQHMVGLQRLIREKAATGADVFAVGDFNVNFRGDHKKRRHTFPYAMLAAVGTYSNWDRLGGISGGTHDKRLIDYVFSRNSDDIHAVSQTMLHGYHSDHKPVLVTYAVLAPALPPASVTVPGQGGVHQSTTPHRSKPRLVDPAKVTP